MILSLHAVVVVPGERVTDNEACQDIVRAKNADDAESEESKSNAEREERLVVNQAAE